MLTTLLLAAALVTPTPEPPFQPTRRQLLQSASGMAKYKPVIGPMVAMAMLPDVVTSAGPRTSGGLGSGGLVGGDLYLADLIDLNLASTGVIRWSATTDPTAAKDVGFSRPSVGLITVTNGGTGLGVFQAGKLTLTTLGTPATPVITQGGAGGATAYSYVIVAKLPDTTATSAGTAGSTATGNAALDAVNYNIVTWAATTNAHCYDVYRTVGGATQGKIATCTTSPLNDTGLAGDASTAPVYNSTGTIGSTTGGVAIGPLAVSSGIQAVSIGAAATSSTTGSTAIGPGSVASTNVSNIAIGQSSRVDGAYSVGIGPYATTAAAADRGLALGSAATVNADHGIAIGANTTVGTTAVGSIALGNLTSVPAATPNVLVGGSSTYPLSNLYFSEGVTDATPIAYTINGTGGVGADIVGGDLQLAPGISTGAAVPGKVKIRNTRAIGTGSTAQTLADLAYFGDVAADGTTNFFNVTGTLPTMTGTGGGILESITGAGAGAQNVYAHRMSFLAGNTTSALNTTLWIDNASVGSGTNIPGGNATEGIYVSVTGAGAGDRAGVFTSLTGATTGKNVGVFSNVTGGTTRVGGTFLARAGTTNTALYAGSDSVTPTYETAIILADNTDAAYTILAARDNGTKVFTIEDNGAVWAKTGTKALVSANPTEFVRITMAATGHQGGICEYCVQANDAANQQVRCGVIPFTFINEASTEACTVGTTSDSDGTPTGTLSAAITAATAANDTCSLYANADSSLAETTLQINYHIRLLGNAATAVAPQ